MKSICLLIAAVLAALPALWVPLTASASAPECGNRFGVGFRFLYCETQDDTVYCTCNHHHVNPDTLAYISEREGVGDYLKNWETHQPSLGLDLQAPECDAVLTSDFRYYNVSPDPEYFHRSSDGRNFWWEGGLLITDLNHLDLRARMACKARQYAPTP